MDSFTRALRSVGFTDYITLMCTWQLHGDACFEVLINRYQEFADAVPVIRSVHEGVGPEDQATTLYGKGCCFIMGWSCI